MNFFHRLKEIGHVAEGYATGGPGGAAKAAAMETMKSIRDRERRHLMAKAGMQGYRFEGAGLSGYGSGIHPRPVVYANPEIPQLLGDPRFGRGRRPSGNYLGDSLTPNFWNQLSAGQKTAVIAGGVVLGTVLFLR